MQRLRRRRRLVLQLEVRMERGEVQRHIVAQVLQHPAAQLLELRVAIVQRRNDQVGDLEPHVGFVPQPPQRIEHRLQMRERDLAVERFGERLQIDVGGINVAVDVEECLARDVAVRHHHGVQAGVVRLARDVDDVLAPDGRLVVGERQMRRVMLQRDVHHMLRAQAQRVDLIGLGLGDVPVLAEEAAHVAAGGAHGEDLRSGEKVVERLLLDRVHGNGRGPPIAELQQASAFVLADEAEAVLAFSDVAVARAQIAVETPVGHRLPPARLVSLRL